MRKLIYIIMCMVLVPSTLSAQSTDSLYVYSHNGATDSFLMSRVGRISHSRTDRQGNRHDDFVMMNVSLSNGQDVGYLLSDLDSVVLVRNGERVPFIHFIGSMTADGSSSRKSSPRRTSFDGDFTAPSTEVDFFWEADDYIWVAGDTPESNGAQSIDKPVKTTDNNESSEPTTLSAPSEEDSEPWPRATKDFYFSSEVTLDEDTVIVYYPGQTAVRYNQVRVAKDQTQTIENTTSHIGIAGDCGTAVARKQQDGTYRFMLEHKAAYLCFLPYIGNNLGRTILKKITVRSDSAVAGLFTLDPKRGMLYDSDTTHVITLKTGAGDAGFILPQRATQNTSAYMVIAPQRGSSRLTCEFTVYDTVLQSEGVFTKIVDLDEIESNMVYVIRANCNNYVVDLGLPVRFLNHNMNAFAPEEYGGYYAWGELEDKGYYNTSNYTYQNTSISQLPKNIRLTDMDVAHMRLGQNFSIPTAAELRMLVDSCTWTWTTLGGHNGYKVTGKNGNNMFLPASGYRSNSSNSEITSRGLFRSSQLIGNGSKRNWYLNFYSNSRNVESSGDDIWLGENIRPVVSGGVQMTDGTLVSVMTDSVQWSTSQTSAKLYASLYGLDRAKLKSAVEVGVVVGTVQNVTLQNGTRLQANVSHDGAYNVTYSMPEDTEYFYRAYAKTSEDSIIYANELRFGRTVVDLGLPSGTKWANINIGAASPDGNGDYYAWGETLPKSSYPNDASNYRWYTHTTWFEPDRLFNVQATDYDAASVNWGDTWMTPDAADLQELVSNCDFTLSSMNGMRGYTIKSRLNNNSLFLPMSGYYRNASSEYATNGYMASSSLPAVAGNSANRNDHASILNNTGLNNWYRTDGVPVRPVYKTNATSAEGTPMYIRTLDAAKQFDGLSETDTLKASVLGLTSSTSTTIGFAYSTDKDFSTDTKVTVARTSDGIFSYVLSGVEPGVRTYYRAFVCSNGTYYYGKTLAVDAVGSVDLGLSVLWTNMDIGAASADSHGDFFRWGATTPFQGDSNNYYTGNKDITPYSGYDTATQLWGSAYRMPTLSEFQELIDNCDITIETSDNGVVGRRFTSRVEGYTDRSIFIPNSGVFTYNSSYRYSINSENSHWTSTNSDGGNAYRVFLGNDRGAASSKSYGFPVRPVQDKLATVRNVGFARNMVNGVEVADTLKGYYHNVSGTNQIAGFLIGESASLDHNNYLKKYDVAGADGMFTIATSDFTLIPGKKYYYRAFARDDREWKYAPVDSFDVAGEVDLGLSVKWANVNIGSQNEGSYGNYYQWGAKEPYYSHTVVQYYQGGKNITPESGFDTASELWGGSWRMPTKEEWKELIDNCQWTWVNANGLFGMRVTSKVAGYTDRSIFLPAAGYYWDGAWRTDNGGSGDYWTSSFYSGTSAYFQSFWNNATSSAPTDPMNFGFTVRPVIDDMIAVRNLDVRQDAQDFTKSVIECYAVGTPSNATVGILYGDARDNLTNDIPVATGTQGSFMASLTGLSTGNSYYYMPYIKQGDQYIAKGEIRKFTTYSLVDLDLPSGLLWMNIDLGADSICGNGDYYQWGATVPFPQTGWNLCENSPHNLTEIGRDAVRNTLGTPYRMATYNEMEELVNNATWEWTTMDDVPGYKVSSKTNADRFIFLPTTGYLNSSGAMQYANTRGNYWSSTWYQNGSARDLGNSVAAAHTGDDGNTYDPVTYGSFLRPVLSVIETYNAQATGAEYLLRGQVNSICGYGSGVSVGFVYSMSPSPVVGATGSTDVSAAVTQSGDYTYTFANMGNNTTYYYRAFIYDGSRYHYGKEKTFVTIAPADYQAVDLGLPSGTKWANMNVGAQMESDGGKFFTWGETYTKENFSTTTYEYYHNSYYDAIGEDIAATKYDAAHAIMGDIWSMPTKAQCDELLDSRYTRWEWTSVDGRNGYRVTSLVEGYTDKSIFLPASGWMNGSTLTSDNASGYFWLSTNYNSDEAYYALFASNRKGTDYDPRWEGLPIRGVVNVGQTNAKGLAAAATTYIY